MRVPWTEPELRDLAQYPDWATFHDRHPSRTYDSWEVKRRRIPGASAGRRRSAESVNPAAVGRLLNGILAQIENYLRER